MRTKKKKSRKLGKSKYRAKVDSGNQMYGIMRRKKIKE